MKLLLDTHIFLWLNQEPEKLPTHILDLCANTANDLYLSHVSPWEIQIKSQLGKLKLNTPLAAMIESQQQENGLQLLPITLPHIYGLALLENHHHDPFDRLLIAQAQAESMLFVTLDSKIQAYSVISTL